MKILEFYLDNDGNSRKTYYAINIGCIASMRLKYIRESISEGYYRIDIRMIDPNDHDHNDHTYTLRSSIKAKAIYDKYIELCKD